MRWQRCVTDVSSPLLTRCLHTLTLLSAHLQSIEAGRRKETEVLEDIMRSGSEARASSAALVSQAHAVVDASCCLAQAARAAAAELKDDMTALSELQRRDMALLREQHQQQMALLREVASDTKDVKNMTAQLQSMMTAAGTTANSTLSSLLEVRQSQLLRVLPPRARC
jgi:hypothetical protein